MPVGDVHIPDPFGWPLCGSSGPLRGYYATSAACRECATFVERAQLVPASVPLQVLSSRTLSRIKTFWCERSARAQESLRRYVCGKGSSCSDGYHNASIVLGEVEFPLENGFNGDGTQPFDRSDPRWPTKCDRCDYVFQPADEWQHNIERLYRRNDTSELISHDRMPAGASYDAVWLRTFGYVGADGIALTVVLPDGTHWHVDSRANNCAFPDDNVHKCWSRAGDPRACNIVAGKGPPGENGGGSILSPGYHGFLGGPNGESPGWLVEV